MDSHHDFFSSHYPHHTPHRIELTECVHPSGRVISTFHSMLYLQHKICHHLSFFIVEFTIPLTKERIEWMGGCIQQMQHLFSQIGIVYSMAHPTSKEYDHMIQQLQKDTSLSLHQYGLPIHLLCSHQTSSVMQRYMHAIHRGITETVYDSLSFELCIAEGAHTAWDDIKLIYRIPLHLHYLFHQYDTMSSIRHALEEAGLVSCLPRCMAHYMKPYSDVKKTLLSMKGCMEIAHHPPHD